MPPEDHAAPLAATPPMGWNTWDCYGASITEDEFKACADRIAERLLPHGWNYVVVDIQWYQEDAPQSFYPETDDLLAHARAKLERKNLDFIVANDVSGSEVGLEADDNAVTILSRDGASLEVPRASKAEIAEAILDRVFGEPPERGLS